MNRVALACENGSISEVFGKTEEFLLLDLEDGKVLRQQNITVSRDWYQSIAEYLIEQQTDVVICGAIGRGARSTFAGANVKVYGGVTGEIGKITEDYLKGNLVFNPMAGMT